MGLGDGNFQPWTSTEELTIFLTNPILVMQLNTTYKSPGISYSNGPGNKNFKSFQFPEKNAEKECF